MSHSTLAVLHDYLALAGEDVERTHAAHRLLREREREHAAQTASALARTDRSDAGTGNSIPRQPRPMAACSLPGRTLPR